MEEYLACIKLFAGNFEPQNFAFCDGQVLPIAQNTALFSLLGNTYGGDGVKDFALPKLDSVKSANGAELKYIICIEGIYPSRA